MKKAALFFALLPSAVALTASGPQQFTKRISNNEIAIEELAYFYFHNIALSERSSLYSERLRKLVSAEGMSRLEPGLAEIKGEIRDSAKHLAKMRQACSDLRRATSGKEFGSVLVKLEASDYQEQRNTGGRILSKLDRQDRQALETYLDTDYRLSFGRTATDFEAMFASQPFPSAETAKITQRSCNPPVAAEERVQP